MRARQIFSTVVLIFLLLIIGCGSSNTKKAESYIDAGMYKEAIELLKIEIQDNPKNPEGHYLLGLAILSLGSDSVANECFNRAILIKSKYREKVGHAYLKVGQKYLLEGNFYGATARFRQAKERNPEIASKIGELYFAEGDKLSKVNEKSTEAISMFQHAFSFDSSLGEKIASMCYEIALSYKKQGDWKRAIQYGLCSIETDPSHIMDFENLSYELLVSLVASDQIEEFEKALVLIDKSSFSFKDKSHIENLGKSLYDKAIELGKRKDNRYLLAFRFGEKFLPDYYKTKENDQEFSYYFALYNLIEKQGIRTQRGDYLDYDRMETLRGATVAGGILSEHLGRRNVLHIHPFEDGRPCFVEKRLVLPKEPVLDLVTGFCSAGEVGGRGDGGDFRAVVSVKPKDGDGEILFNQVVARVDGWYDKVFSLSNYAGEEITVKFEGYATGWHFEHVGIDYFYVLAR